MRRALLVSFMVLLVGGVLAVSLFTAHRAGREALSDFQAVETRIGQNTATALRGYIESLDRDTRLLAKLAAATRQQTIGGAAQDQVILDAFQALATVVAHYRTIALFRPQRPPLVAVDPTEDRAGVAPALVQASAALFASSPARGMRNPVILPGGRSFFLYAAPVGDDEVVVLAADAAMMLEVVSRAPTGRRDLLLADPSGTLWLGCEERARCRALRPGAPGYQGLADTLAAHAARGGELSLPTDAVLLGLPARAVMGAVASAPSPLGLWSVAVIASAADIHLRERAFLWQLVLTCIGVAGAMVTVGVFLLRQHAEAAGLAARAQAAEELAALRERSNAIIVRAEKLVTMGVLSAGIAHEIGTPLGVVRGRAEHLLERVAEGPTADDLRAMIAQIDRISSIIRKLLEFSREQRIEVGPTDAVQAVRQALQLLEWHLGGKHIALVVEAADDLPPLSADQQQFEQVIVNLVMNACDACGAGGRVTVALGPDERQPDRLRIEVIDDGVGIPPENLNAVFDPYFTTKKRGEGTGLGLALVSHIVRSHRGDIALSSALGAGTRVTLRWPLAAHDEGASGA